MILLDARHELAECRTQERRAALLPTSVSKARQGDDDAPKVRGSLRRARHLGGEVVVESSRAEASRIAMLADMTREEIGALGGVEEMSVINLVHRRHMIGT